MALCLRIAKLSSFFGNCYGRCPEYPVLYLFVLILCVSYSSIPFMYPDLWLLYEAEGRVSVPCQLLQKTMIPRHSNFFFFKNQFYLFIYFWLCWVFTAVRGLSLVVARWDYSWLQRADFSLRWLLLLRSTGSRRMGFSSCGTQVQ